MNFKQRLRASELLGKLTQGVIDAEWQYFQEYARRFPSALPGRRYGILPINTAPKDENFIYSSDIAELRLMHLEHVAKNGIDTGHKVRLHIDWLEKMEGKQAY